MFANIISKRALSISRMVCSQVRPLTSIYGVEVKSTAKFSYSAAQKISALDLCIKRQKHSGSTKDLQDGSEDSTDYTKFVIVAQDGYRVPNMECCGDPYYIEEIDWVHPEAYIHNTFWDIRCNITMEVRLKNIRPKNEICHAEVLFIERDFSIVRKVYKEFRISDGLFHKHDIRRVVIRILEEKQKFLKEFENRWAKDVTFVVNGEKCAGDRQYLSAISPVFKKMLQDHAQDEITLEGVESADVLKDFFLAISPLRVQPNPTNVVSLLKLAQDYDIPFLMRSCEEHLKHCYEISNIERLFLAQKYGLNNLKLRTEDIVTNKDLAEILKDKKDILNEAGAEFLLQNIAERLESENSVINNGLAKILKEKKDMLNEPGNQFLFDLIAERLENSLRD
ncbi:BTB/POZ domain-containing protein [Ditylenchus destructor]|nr:BTB/POZ domain-containing protein [Ditylenchus destructor]